MRTIFGYRPMLELLMKTCPFTSARSTSIVLPARMHATAASSSRGTRRSLAKWLRVPKGSTPSVPLVRATIAATVLTVPSPPAATTMDPAPASLTMLASRSAAWHWMMRTSAPAVLNAAVILSTRPSSACSPALALTMTGIASGISQALRPRAATPYRYGLPSADHTAGNSGTGVAGRLRFVVIPHGMDDQRLTEDGSGRAIFVYQVWALDGHIDAGTAVLVGFGVGEVAEMPCLGFRTAMGIHGGVEVRARTGEIRKRAVAKLMHVEANLLARLQTGDFTQYGNRVAFIAHRENTAHG